MATDVLTSLPVKTKYPGDVATFLVDGTNPTQKAAVSPTGQVNVVVTGPGVSTTDPLFVSTTAVSGTIGTVAGNPFFEQIVGPGTSLANPLYVTTEAGLAIGIKNSGLITSTTAVSAGGVAVMTAPFITATKQGKLKHVVVSSSVPLKVEIQTVDNSGAYTTVIVMFTSSANPNANWSEEVIGEIVAEADANGTSTGFAVQVTNEDNSNAASAYANLSWSEE